MLLENGLWRLRVYRLRLRSQSGWGLEQNDTLKMQLLREQKFKRSFETEQHDTSAFWDKFQKKKHIIEHQLPLPAAMCFVRNHTGRLQECQTWIPSSINRISDSKSRMIKFLLADFFKLEELRTYLKPHKAACGGRLWAAKTLENWRHAQGIRKI